MKSNPARRWLFLLAGLSSFPSSPIVTAIDTPYDRLPLSFEANTGQADAAVGFLCRASRSSVLLSSSEAVFVLRSRRGSSFPASETTDRRFPDRASNEVVRMRFLDANPSSRLEGVGEQPNTSNYFIGNDPRKWRTGVPNYAAVRSRNLYPGIDLLYHGNPRQLEYDLVLAPGARAETVRVAFDGIDRLSVNAAGDLVLHTRRGEVRQHRPFVYQEVRGEKLRVAARYVRSGRSEIRFHVGDYDPRRPLVIDPSLSFSTYFGGNAPDGIAGIAVDVAGNSYVTGSTASTDFPAAGPLQPAYGGTGPNGDAFVAKINATGSALVYSTYLGGDNSDAGYAIAADAAGNAYIVGYTKSANFPVMRPFQSSVHGDADVFATKLDPSGAVLVYSTYLGGTGTEYGYAAALDASGDLYVSGQTGSTDFPTRNAFQGLVGGDTDVFLTKFDSTGSALVYSTYLGGSDSEQGGFSMAVDSGGDAYVTGSTLSTDFPTRNPLQAAGGGNGDAFVAKFNPAGTDLVYATYLGGGEMDSGAGIAADREGNAYVTGETFSADFPTRGAFQSANRGPSDVFVTKIDPDGLALVYATYLGGTEYDSANGIAVDAGGFVTVTGSTSSTNFPIQDPFQASFAGGNSDAFVSKIDAAGSTLVWSTFLGGGSDDGGLAVALDTHGDAHVAGYTLSTDFPTENPIQPASGGRSDGFVSFLKQQRLTPRLPSRTRPLPRSVPPRPDAATPSGQDVP